MPINHEDFNSGISFVLSETSVILECMLNFNQCTLCTKLVKCNKLQKHFLVSWSSSCWILGDIDQKLINKVGVEYCRVTKKARTFARDLGAKFGRGIQDFDPTI